MSVEHGEVRVALPEHQVAKGKEDKISEITFNQFLSQHKAVVGHLQIRCSFFLIKLGSLALCAFPPGILLPFLILRQVKPSPTQADVLPAPPGGVRLLSRIYRSSLSCGPAERIIVGSFLCGSEYHQFMIFSTNSARELF